MTFYNKNAAASLLSMVLIGGNALASGDDHSGAPHRGYHGAESAYKWGDLSRDFVTCKIGQEQSPIDIKTPCVVKGKLDKIQFGYKQTPLSLSSNGHTIQLDYEKGSSIKIGKDQYNLVQFHFHTPSEEEIDGKE